MITCLRYSIVESCMRPSGAYAKTQFAYNTLDAGTEAFRLAYFEGPGHGILWSKTLTLRKTYFLDGQYQSEILAQRNVD
jgi:hypothetical protein